jgi:type IV pilus assembly protein PilC
MPKYFYTARSQSGEQKTGTIEAKSEHELAQILRQEGYLLVSASLEELKSKKRLVKFSFPFFGRVSLKEKIFFTRNLRVMIAAGISLPRALRILSEQTKSKKFKTALLDIAEKINKGESFSQALSFHSDIFPELFQNMIKVAEEAGTLEDVLRVLAEQIEKEKELRSKIAGALIYPAVIVGAMFGIGILMLVVVVPKLAETFKELGIELPLTTRFVIFLGTFLSQKWYLMPLIIVGFLVLFRIILKLRRGQRLLAAFVLKIPIISVLVKKNNAAATARTLSSLIIAGVPIVRSLEIISRALGNVYFREAIAEAAEKVRKGEKIYQALGPYQNLYPSLVLEMIKVGEETGETASILAKLADFYEEEVTNTTKNLSAVIEPLLMLFIGAVVGFFAISMVQPMYSMLQAIQ